MPAKEVQDAARRGPAALRTLVQDVENGAFGNNARIARATTSTQFALAYALTPYTTESNRDSGPSSIPAPGFSTAFAKRKPVALAAAVTCWAQQHPIWRRHYWTVAGTEVAHTVELHYYWCGNRFAITRNAMGFGHQAWVQFP
ncbi:MAG: hypothetical protein ACXVHD_28350 [Solirubrobacteraceae bacterium]